MFEAAREVPIRLSAEEPATFVLGQPWNATPEPGLRRTSVEAWYRGGCLEVRATMVDDEVFNDATAHNQRTWELGDVFEVFVRRDDEQGYTEVHVTPDNIRIHFRFDDFEHLGRIGDPSEVHADPDLIESSAERTEVGWIAWLRVPIAAVPGDRLRVSFCRYDASRGCEPVLSTSSPHRVVAFHRPWEWLLCVVGG
jgi:hypothetical protein